MRATNWRKAYGTAAAVALIALTAAGCGSAASPASSSSSTSAAKPAATAPAPKKAAASSSASTSKAKWLNFNASAKTATVKLVAGLTSNAGGFNFDGASKGSMTFNVPQGYKVTVDMTNHGSLAHSASVVGLSDTTLAFPHATTPNATTGTAPGKSDAFTFTASKTGHYRIACLVPGHVEAGMWVKFNVVASGTPSEQGA